MLGRLRRFSNFGGLPKVYGHPFDHFVRCLLGQLIDAFDGAGIDGRFHVFFLLALKLLAVQHGPVRFAIGKLKPQHHHRRVGAITLARHEDIQLLEA